MATKTIDSPPTNPSATAWLWRRWQARLRSNQLRYLSQCKFRLTREGFHFLAVLLFIFTGAVIREINLLILLAGCMIGLLLLQWRFNTRTLLRLTALRRLPESTAVGIPVTVSLEVANPKRLLGSWLVVLEDRLARTAPHPKKLSEQGVAVIDSIPPRGSNQGQYELTFQERGAYEIGPTTISTRFPMGLGRGWRTLNNQRRLIVRPKQGFLKPAARNMFHQLRIGQAAASPKPGSHEADFYGLRPWQSGDSRRWIHWRTSARLGEIAVRQFERQQHRQLIVLLDLYQPKNGTEQSRALCELVVSFLATLATKTARTATDSLSVAVAGKEQVTLVEARSAILITNLLDALATIEPTDSPRLLDAIRGLTIPLLTSPHLVVISTRPHQFADPKRWLDDSAGSKLLSRLGITWLDASAGHLEPYFSWTSNSSGNSVAT